MKLIVIATHMAHVQRALHDSYMYSGTYCTSAVQVQEQAQSVHT